MTHQPTDARVIGDADDEQPNGEVAMTSPMERIARDIREGTFPAKSEATIREEAADWKCAGCGVLSPNKVRSCDCPTGVVTHDKKQAWKREIGDADDKPTKSARSRGQEPEAAKLIEALREARRGLSYIAPAIPVLRTMFMTANLKLGARKAEEMDASNKALIEKFDSVLAALTPAPLQPPGSSWPEPSVVNPDIVAPTGIPYIDSLLHRLLDAQQDINVEAGERMSQSLCDAAALIDEVEATIRKLTPAPLQPPGSSLVEALGAKAWLIETGRQTWWDGRKIGDAAHFTADPSEAMRFARYEDAERARCWLLNSQSHTLRSTEHVWIPPLAASPSTEGVR